MKVLPQFDLSWAAGGNAGAQNKEQCVGLFKNYLQVSLL